jgi:hypothetical protein
MVDEYVEHDTISAGGADAPTGAAARRRCARRRLQHRCCRFRSTEHFCFIGDDRPWPFERFY